MNHNTNPLRTRLNCEHLETRENPDGNVAVAVINGSIFLQGDNAGNHVRLTQDGFGSVFAVGINNTTVNGQGTVFLGTFIPQDVVIHGAGGSDTIEVFGLQIGNTLAIDPGNEYDRVDIGGVNANVVDVNMGAGNDTLVINGLIARSFLQLDGGADWDLLRLSGVQAPAGTVQNFEQMI